MRLPVLALLATLTACAATAPPRTRTVATEDPSRCAERFHPIADASPEFAPGCPAALQGSRLGGAICAAPFLGEGDGLFAPPSTAFRGRFREAMVQLLRSRVATPMLRQEFGALGFTVAEFREGTEVFTLIADSATCVGGRGVFVVREHPTLHAVIEVPHVGFEQETLSEGYRLFMAGARALMIAGTHRCTTDVESPCRGGASGVCPGEPRGYRTSDAAAFNETFFQSMHEAAVSALPSAVAISLHGKRAQPEVPVVVVSDGTRAAGTDAILSRRVASMLTTAGVGAGSCQEPGSSLRLCGTSSVQGRASNGALDACRDVRTAASGAFLHIEQDYDKIITTIEQPLVHVLRQVLPPISH